MRQSGERSEGSRFILRSALTSDSEGNTTVRRLGALLAPIGTGVGGTINQDIGARIQDCDLALALITANG